MDKTIELDYWIIGSDIQLARLLYSFHNFDQITDPSVCLFILL